MRILIIEDELKLAEALSQILSKNRYGCDIATDGEMGLDMAMSGIYNMILLDIMLPKMNGIDLLRRLRRSGISVPVILVTAKSDLSDKIIGLDAGADDYVTKPFQSEELLARIRALSRRNTELTSETVVTFADVSLNLSTYELSCGDRSIRLGMKEMGIAEMLIRSGKRIVSKEEILVKIWGYDTDAEYNNVEVYISLLRKKLKSLQSKVNISTVRGVGYNLYSDSSV